MTSTLLVLAVALVGGLFVWGTSIAGAREYPADKAKQDRAVYTAAAIFSGLVILDSVLGFSGVLGNFDARPPPLMPFFLILVLGVSFAVGLSTVGGLLAKQLTFSALVGFHAFRLLAELLIYFGVKQGIAPVQLSFEGYNFDIVTAITAAVLGIYLRKNPNKLLITIWNVAGVCFLVIIAFIAFTSMPLPFRIFMNEPSNAWVTQFPYVLLPGVLVVAALTGHVVVFRKLRMA